MAKGADGSEDVTCYDKLSPRMGCKEAQKIYNGTPREGMVGHQRDTDILLSLLRRI